MSMLVRVKGFSGVDRTQDDGAYGFGCCFDRRKSHHELHHQWQPEDLHGDLLVSTLKYS